MEYLKKAHPDWIEVISIGKSSQGRPIHVIKMSRPASKRHHASVDPGQKKAILIDAGEREVPSTVNHHADVDMHIFLLFNPPPWRWFV